MINCRAESDGVGGGGRGARSMPLLSRMLRLRRRCCRLAGAAGRSGFPRGSSPAQGGKGARARERPRAGPREARDGADAETATRRNVGTRGSRTDLNCIELDLRFLFVRCIAARIRDVSGALEGHFAFCERKDGTSGGENDELVRARLLFISGNGQAGSRHVSILDSPADRFVA